MLPVLLTFLLIISIVVGLYYAFVVVPENREQSVESLQPVQTSVPTSQTGASASQPCVEHDGTTHSKSTQACPAGQGRSSLKPRRLQLSPPRQQTPGTGAVEQAAANTMKARSTR